MTDPRFPLGTPANRKDRPVLTPVPDRPNWWRDAHGVERYVDPQIPVEKPPILGMEN